MAIKFSELRGLIKETNIQTVSMSDPAYGIQMEKITYKKDYKFSEQRKTISFKNINTLKENKQLYLLNKILPFEISVNLSLSRLVFNNSRIIINKDGIYKMFELAKTKIDDLYNRKEIPNILYNCFYLHGKSDNILNPHLTEVTKINWDESKSFYESLEKICKGDKFCMADYDSSTPYFDVMKYYNNNWNVLEPAKFQEIDIGEWWEKDFLYDYEMISSYF